MNSDLLPVRRALLSVSDKAGVVEFAAELVRRGVEVLSTGGTARALRDAGIAVTEVSEHTGAPEIMDGRVKTLHPRIHGGILGRLGLDDEEMAANAIEPIDLVAVNLYPFARTVAAGAPLDDALEQIDIGGPAMVRAAAKNHPRVAVVVDPSDYPALAAEIAGGGTRLQTRRRLAAKAFAHTAGYDGAIARYLAGQFEQGFANTFTASYAKVTDLRYGENPHQAAALYRELDAGASTLATAKLHQGKPLSFNNLADADAAIQCAGAFGDTKACVIVKHANPCGVAVAGTLLEAYDKAHECDPTSAFGGVIAFTRPLDEGISAEILKRQFVEVLIAPGFTPEALAALKKKPNVRVLEADPAAAGAALDFRPIGGGLLVQAADRGGLASASLEVVSERAPTAAEMADLEFAWRVVKYVKSNAIVYARDARTIGIGAGQPSRVVSAKIAALKAEEAGLAVDGSVMASDAFFPFRDNVDAAAERGIRAIIQPGGARRDDDVIAAADEHGLAMVVTGMRHFRH